MHRPGHIDDNGSGYYSMDRRKYLSTLAAGAALGVASAGLAACGPTTETETDPATEQKMWGYLTVLPPTYWNLKDAQGYTPAVDEMVIRIPYYNNLGIELKPTDIIGFSLKTVGCPPVFAIAYNLTRDEHVDHPNTEALITRNTEMDTALETRYGFPRVKWTKPDTEECPPPGKPNR